MDNAERKVLNGMIEQGNDFIYGTSHTGAKFINTIPFRDLPKCTDKVEWVEIEGGNHTKFGPYRMYQLREVKTGVPKDQVVFDKEPKTDKPEFADWFKKEWLRITNGK